MKPELFSHDYINDYTIRIHGLGGELCYLVLGSERALLIDTLSGVGSIKAYVESLTQLPVNVVLTHAHGDHCGGAWEYDSCYIHPDDIAIFNSPRHESVENRFAFISGSGTAKEGLVTIEDTVKPRPIRTYPVYDGDIFDLGGVQIEVISVPGHTYGTIVLLDRAARFLYTGDACNIRTGFAPEGSTTIEEYRESLLHFKKFQDTFDVGYGGHGFWGGFPTVKSTIIDDALYLTDKILSGTDDRVVLDLGQFKGYLAAELREDRRPVYGGEANIFYIDSLIHKRPHPMIKDKPITYK